MAALRESLSALFWRAVSAIARRIQIDAFDASRRGAPAHRGIWKLTRLLDWKLLSGSHRFPGSDGGTCVMEAATVVAGLEYRSIASVHDLPQSFSKAIGGHLIRLNDVLPLAERQRLRPFVLRMHGSADSRAESERNDYILRETVKRISSAGFAARGDAQRARQCRSVKTLGEALCAITGVQSDFPWVDLVWPEREVLSAHEAGVPWCRITDELVAIIDGGLKIGKQAQTVDLADVEQILEVKREQGGIEARSPLSSPGASAKSSELKDGFFPRRAAACAELDYRQNKILAGGQ